MRLLISAAAAVLFVMMGGGVLRAAPPAVLWPSRISSLDQNALKAQSEALDAAVTSMPTEVKPALQFQKLFLKIMSGALPSEWRSEMDAFANTPAQRPVDVGIASVAKVWLARAEIADIDAVLRGYYRRHVRFPDKFSDMENDLPENLRKDPWGGEWIYQLRAPQGFERLSGQRYQLTPQRFPKLENLSDAIHHREPLPAWTIALQNIAGGKALEFRSTRSGGAVATIQPGGRVDECTLLYIGEGWGLMAGVDQLFTVSF